MNRRTATMLYYGRQSISEEDIARVAQVLRGNLITTGPVTEKFEAKFAEFVGAKYAVAVCNATAALHLALLVAGVGEGDRVVTSPNTFLASANCAAFVRAEADFVDIDPVTYNLCPNELEANWKEDTRAVIPVHYAGGSTDIQSIARIARERKAVVIEDACHALGGSIESNGKIKRIGGHPWADITTFSFHPVKNFTTGEGGMLVTNNRKYAEMARTLRTHGMVRDERNFRGLGRKKLNPHGSWYYEMQHLGFNYRITDFQSALGLSQLEQLPAFLARRREIVARYNQAFSSCEFLTTPSLRNDAEREHTAWHLYTLQVDFKSLGTSRLKWLSKLRDSGIEGHVLYIPVYLQPWYRSTYGYGPGKCPIAEQIYQRAICLPLYPTLSDDEVNLVIDSVLQITRPKKRRKKS